MRDTMLSKDRIAHARRRLSQRGGFGAHAVGSFVPQLTRTCFEKFGFSLASLMTDWVEIVGSETAAACEPERLLWAGKRAARGSVGAADEDGADQSEVRTATLVLRVDPAKALEIEYGAAQIAERVNGYLGFRAVEKVRVVRGAVARAASRLPRPSPDNAPTRAANIDVVGDSALICALQSLQLNVLQKASV